MSRENRYDCWGCGRADFTSATEHMVHVTNCPGFAERAAITRPVHCWSCAGEIDLRVASVCPSCGAPYRGGE